MHLWQLVNSGVEDKMWENQNQRHIATGSYYYVEMPIRLLHIQDVDDDVHPSLSSYSYLIVSL